MAVLRGWPSLSASTRSLVLGLTLVAVPVLGGLLAADVPARIGLRIALQPTGPQPLEVPAGSALEAAATPSIVVLVVVGWMLLASWHGLRLGVGLLTLRRWRARCEALPESALDHLPAWCGVRETGRRARVAWSPDVPTPCVLGLWSPIIALPRTAASLAPATLDAVLVHEYAHVQRRDDLAQFAQHLLLAVCAGHPAAWWLARQLTIEREAACDDWVVALVASPGAYAHCLLSLALAPARGGTALHLAARGGCTQLAARIRRLLDRRRARRLATTRRVRAVASMTASAAVAALVLALAPTLQLTLPSVPVGARRPGAGPSALRVPASLPPTAAPMPVALRPRVVPREHQGDDRTARPPAWDPPATVPTGAMAVGTFDSGLAGADLVIPAVPELLPTDTGRVMVVRPAAVLHATLASAPAPLPPSTPPAGAGLAAPFRDTGLAMASAGEAVGSASREAGVVVGRGGRATATFFARLGGSIGRAF